MEHFTVEGQWWLPDAPSHQVPGTLTFDDDGLELVLYDALRRFKMPPAEVVQVAAAEWRVDPVVHGTSRDDRDFTLFGVEGANMLGPFDRVREVYRPEMAIAGCHTARDEFVEVRCGFDYLDPWADPPSIQAGASDREGCRGVRVDSRELANAEVAGGTVRLVSGVEGTWGPAQVRLTRATSFVVTPTKPLTAKALVDAFVRPLQDLLMFCLGEPVRLTSLRLRAADLRDARRGAAEAFFAAAQPPPGRTRTRADIQNYMAPTILWMRSSPLPLDELLSRWFDLWARRREVVTLLMAPLYAPFMYGQHGFASTFQSAEALHDLVLPTRDVATTDHRARVAAVVHALDSIGMDAGVVDWATKVLTSRNDKPLARKVEDLVAITGSVGEAILAADPSFGATSARERTSVSHGGAEKGLDAVGRYWYGQMLRWVCVPYS